MKKSSYSFVGGVIGLVVFLFTGLLPSIVYGGFGGVVLSKAITGNIEPTILSRVLTVFGMLSGLLATSALFVVVGSIGGSLIYKVFYNMAEKQIKAEQK